MSELYLGGTAKEWHDDYEELLFALETVKKHLSVCDSEPRKAEVLGHYSDDGQVIVYALACGHEVHWVKGELRRCPFCGAKCE